MAKDDAGAAFLTGIQCVMRTLLASSTTLLNTSIEVTVTEKAKAARGSIFQCRVLCSGGDQLENMEGLISMNHGWEFLKSLLVLQRSLKESSCLQLEKISDRANGAVVQRLALVSETEWRTLDVTKSSRMGRMKTAIQLCFASSRNEMVHLCLRTHEFLYKMHAFCSVRNLKFAASVGEMNYLTTFAPTKSDTVEHNGIMLLNDSSHFIKGCETGKITFSSSGWRNLYAPGGCVHHAKNVRLLVASAVFDQNCEVSSETRITLYFSSPYGPLFAGAEKGIDPCSLVPLSELCLTLNSVDMNPETEGLVTADFVLRTQKLKKFPQNLMILFFLSTCCQSTVDFTAVQKLEDFAGLVSNLPGLISANKDVMKNALMGTANASLKQYQNGVKSRTLEDMQEAATLVASSIREIVSSSTSTLFRETCFRLLRVEDSESLEQQMLEKLFEIVAIAQENKRAKKRKQEDPLTHTA